MYDHLRRTVKPLFPLVHRVLERRQPSALWRGDTSRRQIALTFDDGPSERDTPALLRVLAKYGIVATFFVLGERLRTTAGSLLRDVHAAGHQVAIHGYRHRPFPFANETRLRRELDLTRDLIAEGCGIASCAVRDVRPPFGLYTSRVLGRLQAWQYRPVMWSVVPPHWVQSAEETVAELLRDVSPGALVVLHEGHLGGPPVAELVEATLPILIDRGLEFVSVEQMWQAWGGRR
jgi:peptidoglycan/xylan/chitin deacetylase (PgdA/CDA1 family)